MHLEQRCSKKHLEQRCSNLESKLTRNEKKKGESLKLVQKCHPVCEEKEGKAGRETRE
jgi:hypothetical protein